MRRQALAGEPVAADALAVGVELADSVENDEIAAVVAPGRCR